MGYREVRPKNVAEADQAYAEFAETMARAATDKDSCIFAVIGTPNEDDQSMHIQVCVRMRGGIDAESSFWQSVDEATMMMESDWAQERMSNLLRGFFKHGKGENND